MTSATSLLRRLWVPTTATAVVVLLALLAILLFAEGLAEAAHGAGRILATLEPRYGPAVSIAALYLEESGVPLPIFGDSLVMYVGKRFAGLPVELVLAWLLLIAVTVAGSSNLYLAARWWGRPLVEGPLGAILHVTPARVERAERWFRRWGAPAIIFGRHVIGFRIPIMIAAGLFRLPYRLFALSVAASTALWGAAWLALGALLGDHVARFLGHHRWTWVVLPVVALAVAVAGLVRARRDGRLRPHR